MIPDEVAARYQSEGAWTRETIAQRSAATCAANRTRTAIIDGDMRLTFAEAAARVERLAAHFVHLGVREGDVVSWQLPNWWEAAVVHHAILRAGAIPNPLNPAFRARELRATFAEARPRLVVVPAEWRGFAHAELARELGVPTVVVARGEGEPSLDSLLDEDAEPVPAPPRDPSALALLLYTSGTTSDPKGVLHTHRGLLSEIESFREIHTLTAADRYLGGAPVTHIAGLVYGIIAPFVLGTSAVLLDRWDPGEALRVIAHDRATFQTGPPTFLQTLADAHGGAADTSSFRLFSTGGANIPTEVVREAGRRLGCRVKRAYGSTEIPTLTATRIDDDERARLETDGRAIGSAEVRIVGPAGTDAAPGEQGEIWGRAPEMFVGYRSTTLDADAFAADGWFRTGDLGVLDPDGLLRVTGRLKDIIIRGGENISAKEIEDLLCEHPAVLEAAVVGMPDARLGERVCAFVALRDGATLSFDEMAAFLRAREIARHKLPERLEVRRVLAKTESGKIRKERLRAELS